MLPLFFAPRFVLYLRGLIRLPSSVQTPNSGYLRVQIEDCLGPRPGSGYLCPFTRSENQSRVQSAVAQNSPRPHCGGNPPRRRPQHARRSHGRLDRILGSGGLHLQSFDLRPLLVRSVRDHRLFSRTPEPLRPPKHFDYPVRLPGAAPTRMTLTVIPSGARNPSSTLPNSGAASAPIGRISTSQARGGTDLNRNSFKYHLNVGELLWWRSCETPRNLACAFSDLGALLFGMCFRLLFQFLRRLPERAVILPKSRCQLDSHSAETLQKKPLDQAARDVYD